MQVNPLKWPTLSINHTALLRNQYAENVKRNIMVLAEEYFNILNFMKSVDGSSQTRAREELNHLQNVISEDACRGWTVVAKSG